MSHERDQSHGSLSPDSSPDRGEDDPGRASRSALLRKPDHALVSGLLSRKARDSNGVAEGASSAVAAASSSTGSALPESLQRKFESSLGADLSGVRVHTGSDSAAANDAVGAKAYTMGNDIHFGAGHYNPSSSGGEHLLAHEVAHTVQQSGSAQRMQFKLEVSSPHDALEHEADRAADAMIVGAPAVVSGGNASLARKTPTPEEKLNHKLNPLLAPASDWKPDPTDPFQKPATNWGAFPGAAGGPIDAAPPAFADHAFIGPEPRPYIDQYGDTYNGAGMDGKGTFVPGQVEHAERCNGAFQSSYQQLASSYKGATPNIAQYFDAAKELETGDLHTLLGWDKVKGAKDLGATTAGQTGKTGVSVADLSKTKIDTTHDKKQDGALEEQRRRVTVADQKAVSAAKKYVNQVDVALNAGSAVAIAVRALDLKKLKDSAVNLEEEKAKLEKQKSSTTKTIDTTVKLCQMSTKMAFAIAKGDGLSVGGAVADIAEFATGELIKSAMTWKLDEQIMGVESAIKDVKIQINTDEFQLLNDDIANKQAAFDTANKLIPTLKHDMVLAIADAQTAYNTFAELAGKSAGGGADNQKRVEAAIKAIPKVQLLLGRIAEITTSISLPGYSEDSGVGYNAVADIANTAFTPPYCLLKGYQAKFSGELTTWNGRLKSLEAVAAGFAKK